MLKRPSYYSGRHDPSWVFAISNLRVFTLYLICWKNVKNIIETDEHHSLRPTKTHEKSRLKNKNKW